MRCEKCLDAFISEDIAPPCFADKRQEEAVDPGVNECWIPEIGEAERRAIEIRDDLLLLGGLGIADAVLLSHEATDEDLELISVIELEMGEIKREKDG